MCKCIQLKYPAQPAKEITKEKRPSTIKVANESPFSKFQAFKNSSRKQPEFSNIWEKILIICKKFK